MKVHVYTKVVEAVHLENWINETMKLHGAINIFSTSLDSWETDEKGRSVVKTYMVMYMPIHVQPNLIQPPIGVPTDIKNVNKGLKQ